jgi:hypothetical protein
MHSVAHFASSLIRYSATTPLRLNQPIVYRSGKQPKFSPLSCLCNLGPRLGSEE